MKTYLYRLYRVSNLKSTTTTGIKKSTFTIFFKLASHFTENLEQIRTTYPIFLALVLVSSAFKQ